MLKDKQKRIKADKQKRQREEAYQKARDAAGGSDSDQDGGEDKWAAAKKAKFEESRAAMQCQIRAQAGPTTFKQALFPAELVSSDSIWTLHCGFCWQPSKMQWLLGGGCGA